MKKQTMKQAYGIVRLYSNGSTALDYDADFDSMYDDLKKLIELDETIPVYKTASTVHRIIIRSRIMFLESQKPDFEPIFEEPDVDSIAIKSAVLTIHGQRRRIEHLNLKIAMMSMRIADLQERRKRYQSYLQIRLEEIPF